MPRLRGEKGGEMGKVTMWEDPNRLKSVDVVAREMVTKHGRPCADAVRELRDAMGINLHDAAVAIREAGDEVAKEREAARVRQLEREDRERGELIEDMWALWYNGCDCTECPKRIYAECMRDERLGVQGCGAMGYVRERAAAVGIELEW